MSAYDIALKLIQGETIDRKDIQPVIKDVERILRSFKSNFEIVMKQLKEATNAV